MDGKSLNIKQEQLDKLKELFPEAVSEGKVDCERDKNTYSRISIENPAYKKEMGDRQNMQA